MGSSSSSQKKSYKYSRNSKKSSNSIERDKKSSNSRERERENYRHNTYFESVGGEEYTID